jgi:TRAP-type uncharacterized transport system fused permease subunit
MKTGLYSWALAKGLYLIPLLFIYTTILTGGVLEVLGIAFFAAIGLFGMTLFLEGFLIRHLNGLTRILFLCVTVCCFWPIGWINIIGALLAAVLVGNHLFFIKSKQREPAH